MNKAQIAVTDLILTLVILFFVIIFFVYSWNFYKIKLNEKAENNDMILLATKISDILIKESGKPRNWNNNTVEVIGLAVDENVISSAKLNNLLNMDYNYTKKKFKLRDYEFYIKINNLDGTNYISYGNFPSGKIIVIRRLISLNNDEKELEVMLWK